MNLDTLLRDQNSHWVDPSYRPPELMWFRRPIFDDLYPWITKNTTVSLTGLRRVGKSTLMRQVLGQLLDTNVHSDRIMYFTFDRSVVKNDPDTLRAIIEKYASSILHKPLSMVTDPVYIFLDEVQIIPYWQDIVKTYYDVNQNIHFMVSGSSSLFIRSKQVESLAGRTVEFEIHPFQFMEYLRLNKKTNKEIFDGIGLDKYAKQFPEYLSDFFENYIQYGQFPQPVKESYSNEKTYEYIQSIAEKIIEVDLPQLFPIKRPDILRILFEYAKTSSGSLLSYQNLARDIGVDIRTVISYLDWLKKAFLLDICLNQTKKKVKAARTLKKIYLTSPNFSHNTSLGSKVETYVFNFLNNHFNTVEFFRFQTQEIDFVTTTAKSRKIPWEVKYKESIGKSDERTLRNFAKHHNSPHAFLITKKSKKTERTGDGTYLHHIPVSQIEMIDFNFSYIALDSSQEY